MQLYLLILCAITTTTCHAWGKDGHAIIAAIAEDRLTPTAKKGVLNLLSHDDPPANNLSVIASWADEMTHTKQFAWTEPLHFTNVRDASKKCLVNGLAGGYGNCTYRYTRDCVDRDGKNLGFCNSGAITNFSTILKKGDIMQPLHCGMLADHGGVFINVKFPVAGGQGSSWNLHNIWDFGLIVNKEGVEGKYHGLVKSIQTLLQGEWSKASQTWAQIVHPDDWVQESLDMATNFAYRFANGTDIRRTHSRNDYVTLGDSLNPYMATGGVIEEQLARAGVRLATLLNSLWEV